MTADLCMFFTSGVTLTLIPEVDLMFIHRTLAKIIFWAHATPYVSLSHCSMLLPFSLITADSLGCSLHPFCWRNPNPETSLSFLFPTLLFSFLYISRRNVRSKRNQIRLHSCNNMEWPPPFKKTPFWCVNVCVFNPRLLLTHTHT